jgi:cell division cycle 14
MVIRKEKTPEEAWNLISKIHVELKPFRDAGYGSCSYECTIYHCLKGLERGIKLGWYNYDTFNLKEWEHYE